MSRAMMKCGCAAAGVLVSRGGVRFDPPVPYCGVHQCDEIAERPDLAGRSAKCGCGTVRPSDPDNLAFFEYRGPGSRDATELCVCGYTKGAHEAPHIKSKCAEFKPRGPNEFDRFYCGCRGWD